MLKKYQFAYMDASLNGITNQKPKNYGITNNTVNFYTLKYP